ADANPCAAAPAADFGLAGRLDLLGARPESRQPLPLPGQRLSRPAGRRDRLRLGWEAAAARLCRWPLRPRGAHPPARARRRGRAAGVVEVRAGSAVFGARPEEIRDYTQDLALREGWLTTRASWRAGRAGANLVIDCIAHRSRPHLVVTRLRVRNTGSEPVTVE